MQRGSGTVGRESGRGKHRSRVKYQRHEQREKGNGKAEDEDKDEDSGYTGQEAATVTVVKQAGNRKQEEKETKSK